MGGDEYVGKKGAWKPGGDAKEGKGGPVVWGGMVVVGGNGMLNMEGFTGMVVDVEGPVGIKGGELVDEAVECHCGGNDGVFPTAGGEFCWMNAARC
jgi:hypothetical protein